MSLTWMKRSVADSPPSAGAAAPAARSSSRPTQPSAPAAAAQRASSKAAPARRAAVARSTRSGSSDAGAEMIAPIRAIQSGARWAAIFHCSSGGVHRSNSVQRHDDAVEHLPHSVVAHFSGARRTARGLGNSVGAAARCAALRTGSRPSRALKRKRRTNPRRASRRPFAHPSRGVVHTRVAIRSLHSPRSVLLDANSDRRSDRPPERPTPPAGRRAETDDILR